MSEATSVPATTHHASGIKVFEHRGSHVPSWYRPHGDDDTVVMKDGAPLVPQIRVRQVVEDRRWAIQENGELLPQHQFESLYRRKIDEWFRLVRREPPAQGWSPEAEPVPLVERYVDAREDPMQPTNLLPIHYDPNKNRGARPESLYVTADGQQVDGERRLEILREEYAKKGHGKLKSWEVEEVEAADGTRSTRPSALEDKLAVLTDLHRRGRLTDAELAQEVSALGAPAVERGAPRQDAAPAPTPQDPKPYGETTRCGKAVKGRTEKMAANAKAGHERFCKKCEALREARA